jgi:hypothetical protein
MRSVPALASPYAKADPQKRLGAAATDASIVATSVLLFQRFDSMPILVAGTVYLLLRDAMRGQSVGKLLFGLVVINLETGRPAAIGASARRNFLLLLPGANVAAIFLEAAALVRDVQGQRLGDRIPHTQVVEGLGARDLAKAFLEWWRGTLDLARSGKGKRAPIHRQ